MDHPVFSSPQRLSRRLAMSIAAGFLLLLCSFPGIAASPSRTQADALQQELERLVSGLDGSAGIYVLDLRSGRAATVNPQVGFPMASTIKVPVAVHILALVDEGKLDLQQQVQLQEGDIYTAMGGPMALHLTPGSAITVRDLLHMMITVSDNNATDIMIRLGGGAAAVDARMRALGIQGIRVDRYIWEMLAHYMGRQEASPDRPFTQADYTRMWDAARSAEERARHTGMYNDDPRDTSTPAGMASLLKLVWDGKALEPATTGVLKSIMLETSTGQGRLRGMLPDATPVAHKTGTVGEVINDVGVVALPDGRGEVIVAVFVKAKGGEARDRAIAQVARAAHDYFLFVPRR